MLSNIVYATLVLNRYFIELGSRVHTMPMDSSGVSEACYRVGQWDCCICCEMYCAGWKHITAISRVRYGGRIGY